jgi:hypothetical protein
MMTTIYGRFMEDLHRRLDRIAEALAAGVRLLRAIRHLSIVTAVLIAALGLAAAVYRALP